MNFVTADFSEGILTTPEPPCVSVYQPTHRHHPDNEQDTIRFRNLLKAVDATLRQKYGTRDIRPLLEPFEMLAGNESFWNHTLDGLAVLGAPGIFRVYRLQRSVAERAVVAESFHLKPLLRILQSADRYQILALPEVDDLLDDIAELVLRNRGQVVIVPAGRMPTDSDLAAIYRF